MGSSSQQSSQQTSHGESTSESGSYNKAYDALKEQFSPVAGQTQDSVSGIRALLSGDPTGFNAYKQATGFNGQMTQGRQGLTADAADAGNLRSGNFGRRLAQFATGLQNQFAGQYLDRLTGLGQLGISAGNLLSGAGQTSYSKSNSVSDSSGTSQGNSSTSPLSDILGVAGAVGSTIAKSDIRLKDNIEWINDLPDGLPVYSFTYKGEDNRHIGVMAQEVALLRPEALGPVTDDGYMTVDYSKIWN